jgi:hypothetical protein
LNREQKSILKYQTEIPIYELPIATKISSVLELWPWLEAIQQQ